MLYIEKETCKQLNHRIGYVMNIMRHEPPLKTRSNGYIINENEKKEKDLMHALDIHMN
jgi:hypothetical protein